MRARDAGGAIGVVVVVAIVGGCFRGGERSEAPPERNRAPQASESDGVAAVPPTTEAHVVPAPARDATAAAVGPATAVDSESGRETGARGAPRLKGGARSERELATWVLQALKEKDARKLHILRVDRAEFVERIYPETPEAKGKVQAEFQWDWLNVHSFKGVDEALRKYGGLDLELIDVIPTQGIKEHPSFKFWSYCELIVRFPDGEERQIQVFGSMVEMDGVFKILGFPT